MADVTAFVSTLMTGVNAAMLPQASADVVAVAAPTQKPIDAAARHGQATPATPAATPMTMAALIAEVAKTATTPASAAPGPMMTASAAIPVETRIVETRLVETTPEEIAPEVPAPEAPASAIGILAQEAPAEPKRPQPASAAFVMAAAATPITPVTPVTPADAPAKGASQSTTLRATLSNAPTDNAGDPFTRMAALSDDDLREARGAYRVGDDYVEIAGLIIEFSVEASRVAVTAAENAVDIANLPTGPTLPEVSFDPGLGSVVINNDLNDVIIARDVALNVHIPNFDAGVATGTAREAITDVFVTAATLSTFGY